MVRFDRTGTAQPVKVATADYNEMHLSPDGTRLTLSTSSASGQGSDLWLVQLSTGLRSRLSLSADGGCCGAWSHDGKRVFYANAILSGLRVRVADGSAAEQQLATPPGGEVNTVGWTGDDRYVVYMCKPAAAGGRREIWVAPVDSGPGHAALKPSGEIIDAALSPDGRWLAYSTIESGHEEIYVVRFGPELAADKTAANRWQLTTEGGMRPQWSPKGDEIFFTNGSLTILFSMPVQIKGEQIQTGTPSKLFDLPAHPVWGFYAVAPDGKSIYLVKYAGQQTAPLTVLLNQPAGAARR